MTLPLVSPLSYKQMRSIMMIDSLLYGLSLYCLLTLCVLVGLLIVVFVGDALETDETLSLLQADEVHHDA
jgi:hypothetical protein